MALGPTRLMPLRWPMPYLLRRGFALQLLIATTAGARFSLKRGDAGLLGLDLRANAGFALGGFGLAVGHRLPIGHLRIGDLAAIVKVEIHLVFGLRPPVAHFS